MKNTICCRYYRCLLFVILFNACGIASLECCAFADESNGKKPVLVLHSYLISPARRAGLQQAATKASAEFHFVECTSDEDVLRKKFSNARLILLDMPHSGVVEGIVNKASGLIQQSQLPYVLIGELDQVRRDEPMVASPLSSQHNVPAAWAAMIREYYRYGGQSNTEFLMMTLAGELPPSADAEVDLPDAKLFPRQGFYHPDWNDIETDISSVAVKPRPPNVAGELR